MKDYLEWDEANSIVKELYNNKKYNLSLLVFISINTGMRIADILSLKWEEIVNKECLCFKERKTHKIRKVYLGVEMQAYINLLYKNESPSNLAEYCFISQKHSVFTVQRINQILKEVALSCEIKDVVITTHTLRKTFGRKQYCKTNGMAINNLVEYFSHPSVNFTLEYLQIEKEKETIFYFNS